MKLLLISTVFALCICGSPSLRGQAADITATVQYNNGQTVTWTDLSDVVGVQPGELITVTVQLSRDLAGSTFEIGALDGSEVAQSPKSVGADGTLSFASRATSNPGTNRIKLRNGSTVLLLKFWVLNVQNPQDNPPVITPQNSGN